LKYASKYMQQNVKNIANQLITQNQYHLMFFTSSLNLSLSALFGLNCCSILSENNFFNNIFFYYFEFYKITCEKVILRIVTAEQRNLYQKNPQILS
jgi:hypothetical protein